MQCAVDDGQKALALTDSGNLFGAIDFYKACKAADIRPILGMTAFCAEKSADTASGADNPTYQLTLLASNERGWQNLRDLSTFGYLHGFHYRPRIDRERLARHAEGLIVLSGGLSGEIERAILANDLTRARQRALEFQEMFGEGNFFLELMSTGYEPQDKATQGLVRLHQETGVPVVATNDVHYAKAEDWIVQDVQMAIRDGRVIGDPNRFRMGSRELHFKSCGEMAERFASLPEALSNTMAIAERCSVEIDFNTYHLPIFETGSDETPEDLFVRQCHEGARDRYGEISDEIQKRLDYEIGVVLKLGFASYFLITADFIDYARDEGIPVGPGRGSAAGSMVAYSLRITDLDPLRYNLIFERFLNVDRISMPDIDVDFCGERRDEVIDYVRAKYGAESVSQIITFGTMASRGVLRDVGRVLEVPLAEVDAIAKKVPQGPGASLRKALEEDKDLQEIRNSSTGVKKLFDLGLELEGLVRHSSIHAAGVVVSDKPLQEYVPLAKVGDGSTMTQWPMTELEEVGLLKVDFLGLKTLTILQESARLIREIHGVELDLDSLPLDDEKSFQLMTRGDTLGVFQLESSGMRELLSKLKPDNFEDVIAVLALYRPGPLGSGMVDMFVRRKHGEEPTLFPHESIEPVLSSTYGVIVYQEQVMRIANILAGFSMNEADSLRKAMGKKKPEVMAKFKDKFVSGAEANGHRAQFARELFETIEFFAGYGFNKSHSAAYALLTYRTAYLKAHYPVEFLAANLTVESGNSDKVKEFVDDAKKNGVLINTPNINLSRGKFGVKDGGVTYGLRAIKGVGTKLADALGLERESGGEFRSIQDLCERLDPTLLNKGAMEALCKAGAFDGFGPRKSAFESIDVVLRSAAQARDDRRRGQGMLFAPPDERSIQKIPDRTAEWPANQKLAHEKEAIGFYLSGHPFEKQGRLLSAIAGTTTTSLTANGDDALRLAGMISGLRIMQIRSGRNAGQKMARFFLEDLHGTVEVTCFSRHYQKLQHRLEEEAIVFVSGKLDSRGEDTSLLLEDVVDASEVVSSEVEGLVVHLDSNHQNTVDSVAEVCKGHRGPHRLMFEVQEGDQVFRVRADSRFSVQIDSDLLADLSDLVGPEKLSFTRK